MNLLTATLKEWKLAEKYYLLYLKHGKVGSSGYAFAQESLEYVKQQLEKTKSSPAFSPADELKKYKELFYQGIITEAEFKNVKDRLLKIM